MNFEIVTIKRFKVNNLDFYYRIYAVIKKKNELLKITNIMNGDVLFDNLNPDDVLINNNPMRNLQELKDVIFNSKCNCSDEKDDGELKIFDLTFDKTFE